MELTDIAQRIVDEAQRYAGWGYGAGLSVAEQDAQRRIDCSSLTARILCAVWGVPIGGEVYRALVLTADMLEAYGPWVPVNWITSWPGPEGEEIALADLAPGEAALVQEWSRLPSEHDPGRGHAYIVIGSDTPGWVHLLESTSLHEAGVSWRSSRPQETRGQVPVHPGSGLPEATVPISSLGEHRAAVLYPRAPATLYRPDLRNLADAPTAEAKEARMVRLPTEVEDAVDAAKERTVAWVVAALQDGRITSAEAQDLLEDLLDDLLDAALPLPEPAEGISDLVIDQVAAPIAAQLTSWAAEAVQRVGQAIRPDPERQLKRAERLRERGKTEKAARLEERARETLRERRRIVEYLRGLR